MRKYCKDRNVLVCAYAPLGLVDFTDADEIISAESE
jgi:hypothetical protein